MGRVQVLERKTVSPRDQNSKRRLDPRDDLARPAKGQGFHSTRHTNVDRETLGYTTGASIVIQDDASLSHCTKGIKEDGLDRRKVNQFEAENTLA